MLDPGRLLSLVTEAVLVAECALDLIDGGRYDEPQGDPDQGYEHGVMKNNAYPGANPAAFQPVDPGADRRGENDRTEEQRNDEPCLPDQDGRHQYPDDDERPDGHAAREARKIIARLVLRRNQIDPFATCFNRQRTLGTPRGPDRHPRCRFAVASAGQWGAERLSDGREDLVRMDACQMVVDRGGDDQLVGLGLGDDRLEAFAHRVR